MAADEKHPKTRTQFETQAAAYRKLATERAKAWFTTSATQNFRLRVCYDLLAMRRLPLGLRKPSGTALARTAQMRMRSGWYAVPDLQSERRTDGDADGGRLCPRWRYRQAPLRWE
jgi:hypothetical protein